MPAVVAQATSWSYSRYGTYKQCPLKFKLLNIDKMPITKGPALIRGAEIHDMAEKYLKGQLARLPKELDKFKAEFKFLKNYAQKKPHLAAIEEMWAFTKDWGPSQWNDWKNCWVRIKLDMAHIVEVGNHPEAIITDWKTGKFRNDNKDDYMEQLELYALSALLKWEHLIEAGLTVRPRLVYIDQGIEYYGDEHHQKVFTGADLKPLKKSWEKRIRPMMNDRKFAPKPNQWCGYCEFRAAAGGPCKY